MNDYEGIFIVKPEAEKEELSRLVEMIQGIITKQGGDITKVDLWGKRPLGYQIRKQNEGEFVYTSFKLEPSKVSTLVQSIRLQEEILKAMVTRAESPQQQQGESTVKTTVVVEASEKGGNDGGLQ